MKLRNALIAAAGDLALTASTAKAQTGYLYPRFNGGYTYIQPGTMQPPVQINPTFNGGYMAIQPGTLNPPVYANPTFNGGYTFTQPGAPVSTLPPCYWCNR